MVKIFNGYMSRTPQQVRGLGFTLVEMAVVLAVIAAIMGSAIALVSASLEGRSYSTTTKKLQILQQALIDYRIAYNRLPCPAASSTTVTDSDFGVEAATTSNCTGGSPAADTGDSTAAVGMVPVRTLGLQDDMAIDSWGRRIRYAVSPAFVISDAFDGTGATVVATSSTTRLTVNNNDSGNALTNTALFVLVSHGANGHGAIGAALGGTTPATVSGGITNTNELLNCKCTSSATFDGAATLATFVQGDLKPDPADPLNNFDDIVVFSKRVELRDADE